MESSDLQFVLADYRSSRDCQAILQLMDIYARDPMGGGKPLATEVADRLCEGLATFPGACTVLAWWELRPIGLINAFPGYSTFAAQPLLNIHDVVVEPAWRGRQIFDCMLSVLEQVARERGCCKLTLEVLSGNEVARRVYQRNGFDDYQLSANNGTALFMQKPIA